MVNEQSKPKTKDELNLLSQNGLHLFQLHFPQLSLQIKYALPISFLSPFTNGESSLSIFFSEKKQKWMFKDHAGKGHFGDMFCFIGFLHNLNIKRNFKLILKIVEEELKNFNTPSEENYTVENIETKEKITLIKNAPIKSFPLFPNYFSGGVHVPVKVVESYTLLQDNKLLKNECVSCFTIDECGNSFFYILNTDETFVTWGVQPKNYFLGLKQSLDIAYFKSPINRNNLLLCDKLMDVLAFLAIGAAAILVDPKTVWGNSYFVQVIKPSFSNLIVAFDEAALPFKLPEDNFIQFFGLKNFIEPNSDSLINYIKDYHHEPGFLAPLWDLYEYLDDDILV